MALVQNFIATFKLTTTGTAIPGYTVALTRICDDEVGSAA